MEIKKRRGRWGTTHFYIDGIPELKGDYQRTGNAFDTEDQAREFLKTFTAPASCKPSRHGENEISTLSYSRESSRRSG